MTKKHFIALADVIKNFRIPDGYANTPGNVLVFMTKALEDFCADQNPRFNRDRWLGYIAGTNGKNGGKVRPCTCDANADSVDSCERHGKVKVIAHDH